MTGRVSQRTRRAVHRIDDELRELGTTLADQPPAAPDPDVIGLLEAALVRARAGELRAVGIATTSANGVIATSFAPGGDRWALHAAASYLAHRVLHFDD